MSDGTEVLTRRFAAGPVNFVVRCPSTAVKDAVEQLFVDLGEGDNATIDDEIILVDQPNGQLSVRAADRDAGPMDPNEALASVVTSVSRLVLDNDPSRLHLHCAALSSNARGVLISAPSGTGKTTLAAALALADWSYVSDEAVALEPGSSTATGFAKPLLIKPGGGAFVPELRAARVSLDSSDEDWWLVPVSALSAPIDDELEPALIVILHRAVDGSTNTPPTPTYLHPADAVVALMGQTMDAERFGPEAAATLGSLASRCTCVSLPVGPVGDAVSILSDLIGSTPEVLATRVLVHPSEPDADGWRVIDQVRSLSIGDRVVIHDTAGGAIAALDEAGAALWLALIGQRPAWLQPETMRTPGTLAFLEQLTSIGLIECSAVAEATPT